MPGNRTGRTNARLFQVRQGFVLLALAGVLLVGCENSDRSKDELSPSNSVGASATPTEIEKTDVPLASVSRLIQRGEFEEAESQLRKRLLSDPNDLESSILRVRLLERMQRWREAALWCQEVGALHEEQSASLMAQSAELLSKAGDPSGALGVYRELLVREPMFHQARLGYLRMLRQYGFVATANQQARILMQHLPLQFTDLVGLIQPSFPAVTFETKPDPQDAKDRLRFGQLNLAAAMQSRGDVRDALAALTPIEFENELGGEVIAMKAWLLAKTQQWPELTELINEHQADDDGRNDIQSLQGIEAYASYWMALGGLAIHERDPAAVTCFMRAIEIEPNFAEAYDGLLNALELSGTSLKSSKSSEAWKEAVRDRRKQVADTRFFIDQIGAGQDVDGRMSRELGKRLGEMGRPMESVAFQELLLQRQSDAQRQLAFTAQYKQKIAAKFPEGRDRVVIRMGLDADLLPSLRSLNERFHREPSSAQSLANQNGGRFADPAKPNFTNVSGKLGFRHAYLNADSVIRDKFQIHQSLGTGVAAVDYDLDGLVDVYIGQGGFRPTPDSDRPTGDDVPPNELYRNLGNRFQNETLSAGTNDRGYTHGVASGDWNQDGWPDLLVGNLGSNVLLINQGDGTYQERVVSEAWSRAMFTASVAIADVNGDSLPDLIEVNYLDDDDIFSPSVVGSGKNQTLQVGPLYYDAAVDRAFLSLGDGTAKAEELGTADGATSGAPGTGLGLLITDLNGVPGNEIFVANDQMANHFWVSQPGSRKDRGPRVSWIESSVPAGVAYAANGKPLACMGIASGDFDGNGSLDLHITNYVDEWSNLYLQQSPGTFQDAAAAFGLDQATNPNVGFGTQVIDFDNNRSLDIAIGNGHTEDFSHRGIPFEMPTQVLRHGVDGFLTQAVEGDDQYWSQPHLGRALAKLDYNRDGRLDFVLTDLFEPTALFENRTSTPHHFLQLELIGSKSERDVIGTRVEVRLESPDGSSQTLVQYVQAGDGYMCKNESAVFFGLGDATRIDRITVTWPNGDRQRFGPLVPDHRYLLIEDQSETWTRW